MNVHIHNMNSYITRNEDLIISIYMYKHMTPPSQWEQGTLYGDIIWASPCVPPPTCPGTCTCWPLLSSPLPPGSGALPVACFPPTPAPTMQSHSFQCNLNSSQRLNLTSPHTPNKQHIPHSSMATDWSCIDFWGRNSVLTLARCRWVSWTRSGWWTLTSLIMSPYILCFLYIVMAKSGSWTATYNLKVQVINSSKIISILSNSIW